MSANRAAPRLHVLLARHKPLGVVMRRGPSKTFCTMLWDLRTDAITMGQWIKARLYPMRSDLSPDGRYLIYFALNGRWQSETRGSYTAISRAPYLKAITLCPKGDGAGRPSPGRRHERHRRRRGDRRGPGGPAVRPGTPDRRCN